MSIIKLTPAFKDYLWGGTKLKENYGKKTDMDPVAESWELSVHPDGPSIVASGEYEGLSFPKYLEKKGKGVLGTKGNTFEFFPILIKFIDAKQPLSIQVHPDNEYALRVEHEYGKTEMWYILDCEPDSFLYFGVNKEITKEEFISENQEVETTTEMPKVEDKPSEIEAKEEDDDDLEKDLFNLIDSMYKDDEESGDEE